MLKSEKIIGLIVAAVILVGAYLVFFGFNLPFGGGPSEVDLLKEDVSNLHHDVNRILDFIKMRGGDI